MDPIQAPGREADFYAFLHRTSAHLRTTREVDKVVRHYVRASQAFFDAEAACVAALAPGEAAAEIVFSHPGDSEWDREFLGALIAGRRPEFPRGLICAPLDRRGRPWGLLALRRAGSSFERWQERSLGPLAAQVGDLIERIDRERLAEVRARIDGKMMRELAPKDLYYQILDGLHQLTRYNHSAALYILDPGSATLQLVAEQIAWRKGKSEAIGSAVALDDEFGSLLTGGLVYGFDRRDSGWREWTGRGAVGLAEALSRLTAGEGPPGAASPPVGAMLCGTLGGPRASLGLVRLAALRPGSFGEYERDILAGFSPTVSLVLQRSQTAESLQERMLFVERRSTLAHLARGVAHDVNNALGAMMPLVQQMQSEVVSGTMDPATLQEDLARIESSIEVCRRIFGGLLRFARGSSRHDGVCDLRRAVDVAADVLRESLVRQGIRIELSVPDGLPSVRGGQEDIERVLLNLATNAREAMLRGGILRIRVDPDDEWVRVRIEDTGRGIPAPLVRQIDRPFFSTKPDGWGLGLPTCRSIVAEIGGELEIESEPERGTRVTVLLRPAVVREMSG